MSIKNQFKLRQKTQNEEAIKALRAIAKSPRSVALGLADRIQRDAESLAEAMTEIHGGRWTIKINHGCHFVLVAREFD